MISDEMISTFITFFRKAESEGTSFEGCVTAGLVPAVAMETARCVDACVGAWSPHYMCTSTVLAAVRGIEPGAVDGLRQNLLYASNEIAAKAAARPLRFFLDKDGVGLDPPGEVSEFPKSTIVFDAEPTDAPDGEDDVADEDGITWNMRRALHDVIATYGESSPALVAERAYPAMRALDPVLSASGKR